MLKEVILHDGFRLTCPKCGSDSISVRQVGFYNPNEEYVTVATNPLGIVHTDGASGGDPFITLYIDCAHCPVEMGIYLHLTIMPDGRTRVHWDLDTPDDGSTGGEFPPPLPQH
jgi:hypothetical protein